MEHITDIALARAEEYRIISKEYRWLSRHYRRLYEMEMTAAGRAPQAEEKEDPRQLSLFELTEK